MYSYAFFPEGNRCGHVVCIATSLGGYDLPRAELASTSDTDQKYSIHGMKHEV